MSAVKIVHLVFYKKLILKKQKIWLYFASDDNNLKEPLCHIWRLNLELKQFTEITLCDSKILILNMESALNRICSMRQQKLLINLVI